MTDKMTISDTEAETILSAMSFVHSAFEATINDVDLCVKILEIYPEFEEVHGYLRNRWGH